MKKLLFVFPIVALLAAGCNSNQQVTSQTPVTQNTNPTPTPTPILTPESTTSVPSISSKYGAPIVQKSVSWNGQNYVFTQYCNGTQKTSPDTGSGMPTVQYCLGTSTLVLQNGSASKVIESDTITDPTQDVSFLSAQLIPSTEGNGNVLLEYGYEPCIITEDDCGAGLAFFPSYDVDLKAFTYKKIPNFSTTGNAYAGIIWNPAGAKAIFVPITCGGAGCDERPLTGYDLTTDQIIYTSTAKASGDAGSTDMVSRWQNITWQNDSHATADIIAPDGTKQTIQISF